MDVGAVKAPTIRRSQSCKQYIAKSVFQVHGVDAEGKVLIRRKLKRRYVLAFFEKLPPCLVGIEACVTSHHWSRELKGLGHSVRLMPPAYVKPYVKRQTRLIHAPAAMDSLSRSTDLASGSSAVWNVTSGLGRPAKTSLWPCRKRTSGR